MPRGELPLFVYGTLLAGEPSHRQLGGARLLGEVRTERGWALFDLGPYPAMVRAGRGRVAGELYAVHAKTLARLDQFEGHPDLFRRGRVRLDDGREAVTYVGVRDVVASRPRIPRGRWRDRISPAGPRCGPAPGFG